MVGFGCGSWVSPTAKDDPLLAIPQPFIQSARHPIPLTPPSQGRAPPLDPPRLLSHLRRNIPANRIMIAIKSDVSAIQRLDRTGIHLGLLGAFFGREMGAESTAKGDGVLILSTAGDDVAFVDGAAEEVVEGADVALVGGGVEADDGIGGGGAAVGVAAVLGSLAR